jgi:hypothetical protein
MSLAKDVKKDVKKEYERLAREVETQRDDIHVRLHLLNLEAKQEWHELEHKYEQLRGKLKKASEVAETSSGDVKTAAELLVDELKAGYQRIKSSL